MEGEGTDGNGAAVYLRVTSYSGSVGSAHNWEAKEQGQSWFWWVGRFDKLVCRAIGGWMVCLF